MTVAELPTAEDEVITECGRLPLALSVVGAMLRGADAEFWQDTLSLIAPSNDFLNSHPQRWQRRGAKFNRKCKSKHTVDRLVRSQGDFTTLSANSQAVSLRSFVQGGLLMGCRLARHPLAIPLAMTTSAYGRQHVQVTSPKLTSGQYRPAERIIV